MTTTTKVQRWDFVQNYEGSTMARADDGDYIEHSDYAALESDRDAWMCRAADWANEIERLRAENAALLGCNNAQQAALADMAATCDALRAECAAKDARIAASELLAFIAGATWAQHGLGFAVYPHERLKFQLEAASRYVPELPPAAEAKG